MSSTIPTRTIAWLTTVVLSGAANLEAGGVKVHHHRHAEAALKKARAECRPLLVHVVPTVRAGREQLAEYYGDNSPIPRELLEYFVILTLPRDRFGQLAGQLEIDDVGGMRTVSPYALEFTDFQSLTTTWIERDFITVYEPRRLAAVLNGNALPSPYPSSDEYFFGPQPPQVFRLQVPDGQGGSRTVTGVQPGCGIRSPLIDVGRVVTVESVAERAPKDAIPYLWVSANQFEGYAMETYPGLLTKPEASNLELMAALRYIATRGGPADDRRIRDLFTSTRTGPFRNEVYDACVAALLATATDAHDLAAFFAWAGAQPDLSAGQRRSVQALHELVPASYAALLEELLYADEGIIRRRLAYLLMKISDVRPAESIRFWGEATDDEVRAALIRWADQISTRHALTPPLGLLPSPPPAER